MLCDTWIITVIFHNGPLSGGLKRRMSPGTGGEPSFVLP